MEVTVDIDIGGEIFKTKRSTLNSIKGSYLSSLQYHGNETLRFDRDPHLFRHILNAHRNSMVHFPRDVCPSLFKQEMKFWKIPFKLIAPCCWKYMYETENDVETLNILLDAENKYVAGNKVDYAREKRMVDMHTDENEDIANNKSTDLNHKVTSKEVKPRNDSKILQQNTPTPEIQTEIGRIRSSKVWLFLNEPGSSTAAKIWLFFYIIVVLISVVVYVIWLEPSVRVPMYLIRQPFGIDIYANETLRELLTNIYTEKLILLALSDPHPALLSVELFCVVFFILETIVHFSVCPEKLRYFRNPYHLLKIVLCLTMIISTFLEIRKDIMTTDNYDVGRFYYSCKCLNVLRLLLIFRLHKIYNGLHIMLLSLKYSLKELSLLVFSFIIAVVVYGCLMFSAEIESDMFPSTQITMWWSVITMTTIGYGDFVPKTTWGYVVGIVCAVNGIIVIALPIAAIASTFSTFYTRNGDLQKYLEDVRKQDADVTRLDLEITATEKNSEIQNDH